MIIDIDGIVLRDEAERGIRMSASVRERGVRDAIRGLLEKSGAFDSISPTRASEGRGEPSGRSRSVSIEPMDTTRTGFWDDASGGRVMTSRVALDLRVRHEDPRVRDETVEHLLDVAANALEGVSLGSLTLPGSTLIASWAWQRATTPERRIVAVVEFQYVTDGQSELGVAP